MAFHLQCLLPRPWDPGVRKVRSPEIQAYIESTLVPVLGLLTTGSTEIVQEESRGTVLRWTSPELGATYLRIWGGRQRRNPVVQFQGAVDAFHTAGLNAPRILHADCSSGIRRRHGFECLVETASEGTNLGCRTAESDLRAWAASMAQLHNQSGECWGRPWLRGQNFEAPPLKSWNARLHRMERRLRRETTGLGSGEIDEIIHRIHSGLQEQKNRKPALIHGDAHPGHVFVNEGRVAWIDMDNVQFGLPEWDLSVVALWLDRKPWKLFLEAYEKAGNAARDPGEWEAGFLYAAVKRLCNRAREERRAVLRGKPVSAAREWRKADLTRVRNRIRKWLAEGFTP